MPALSDHDHASLARLFQAWGFKPAHAPTLLRAFYQAHGTVDPSTLRLGKPLVARLQSDLPLRQSRIQLSHASPDGTRKLLVRFDAGGAVEAVMMPAFDPARAAGCISSQIGCAMGCDFCASARPGLERNLSCGEIIEQFLHLRAIAAHQGRRLSTLVFMGMGEPMHNLDAVIPAIQRMTASGLGELGARHITVSTVGIVPGIDRLAQAGLGVHLALSLHAPDDLTRSTLVPANRRYPVSDIMAAARRFQDHTGRIVNIEYCLIQDVNDSPSHAKLLSALMRGFRAHVNLIPYNPIGASLSGRAYTAPSPHRVSSFLDILREDGVVAHPRRTRGDSINAACGQLRETA